MQPRRVIFPDTVPVVSAAIRNALPLLPPANVGAKRPASLAKSATFVQYRNDSGPESGLLKTERYGINCWAPTLRGAMDALRTVQAEVRSNLAGTGAVVAATGGAGPYEVQSDADSIDNHEHAYCVIELTVRGSNY